MDGQANCSRFFVDEPKTGLEQALTKSMVSPTIARCQTRYPNIDIITATSALNDIVSLFYALPENVQKSNAEKIVKDTEKPWYSTHYDYVLVDLPPALNKITECAISACDYVFVPIELQQMKLAAAKDKAEKYGIKSEEDLKNLQRRLDLIPMYSQNLKAEISEEQLKLKRVRDLIDCYEKITEERYISDKISAQKEREEAEKNKNKTI